MSVVIVADENIDMNHNSSAKFSIAADLDIQNNDIIIDISTKSLTGHQT